MSKQLGISRVVLSSVELVSYKSIIVSNSSAKNLKHIYISNQQLKKADLFEKV
jgi:hypothetical protein